MTDTSPMKRKQARGAVAPLGELEQLGRGVDKARGALAGLELRVVDDVFEEGQVGRHAADAEFAQRPIHARRSPRPRSGPRWSP